MRVRVPNKRQAVVGVGLAAVLVGLALVAFHIGPLSPTRITVTPIAYDTLTPSVFGIGHVEARQSWLMGPTVAGRVLRVHVDVGQTVQAGQLLAEMDPVDLNARVQAQAAALARAHSVVSAAEAQVSDAQAKRALALANLQRQQDLARQQFISASALEGREQEWRSADAGIQAAQATLQAARQDVQRLQAEHAAALQQQQNTRLVAPAHAVVLSREAEPGSTVVAGQPVLRLVNPASLWVKLRVDQGRSAGLAKGLAAHIVLRSQPRQGLDGRVARVDPQADSVTEERIAQVDFVQRPDVLSVGEMAEVTLRLEPIANALVVPQASVQTHQGRSGVWRVQRHQLEFVPVQWGVASLDGRIQALQGLSPGDTVVVYSDKPLSADDDFKVVEAVVNKAMP
jgi:HlyD family secretion protein